MKEAIEQGREFFYSGGKQTVRIGDKFNWNGVHAGIYEVVGWGTLSGVYSPSGLGGTSSVFVRDEKFVVHEWCGDSVAAGVARALLTPVDGKVDLLAWLKDEVKSCDEAANKKEDSLSLYNSGKASAYNNVILKIQEHEK